MFIDVEESNLERGPGPDYIAGQSSRHVTAEVNLVNQITRPSGKIPLATCGGLAHAKPMLAGFESSRMRMKVKKRMAFILSRK